MTRNGHVGSQVPCLKPHDPRYFNSCSRAYAARLAKQVAEEAEGSRRKSTGAKKRDGKD